MNISDKLLGLARKGELDEVVEVLEKNPECLNASSEGHNRTLLWEAVNHGRVELAHELIRRGASPNIPGRNRADICVLLKPYVIAKLKKRKELLKVLEERTEWDLYTLSFLGKVDEIRKLVSAHPELVQQRQPEDQVWEVLPLHVALVAQQDEVVAFLFSAGTKVDSTSKLMYEIAVGVNRMDYIEKITGHGGLPSEIDISQCLGAEDRILNYFLHHGADVNRKAAGGWPPVAYASRGDKGEHPEKVARLLSLGAEVNATGPKNRTALHAASQAGFLSVVKILVEHGADVQAKMTSGETPLTLARRKRKTQVIDYLVGMGAKE